jgi:ribosome maturation factor RimP
MTEGLAVWKTINEVAQEEGVELFDVDFPSDARRGGVVRVYITKTGQRAPQGEPEAVDDATGETVNRSGVMFEDCVRVCKKLLDIDEKEPFIPDTCTLEVSSPGVNRRLRLPEHFAGAIGERVRIKYRNPETSAYQVILGTLRSKSGDTLEVENESKKEVVSIALKEVKEARVDFKF